MFKIKIFKVFCPGHKGYYSNACSPYVYEDNNIKGLEYLEYTEWEEIKDEDELDDIKRMVSRYNDKSKVEMLLLVSDEIKPPLRKKMLADFKKELKREEEKRIKNAEKRREIEKERALARKKKRLEKLKAELGE